MHLRTLNYTVLAVGTLLAACSAPTNEAPTASVSVAPAAKAITVADRPDGWDDYWYSGKAEINTYDYTQNRYGEDREGDAVLVFVTEPFLPEQQVKDDGAGGSEEAISVLKLNRIHRFNTGIYDYSLMLSAFTPVSRDRHPHTLKTTLSAQDWCGHSWYQLNHRKGKFQSERRSYFQKEADAKTSIDAELLEDELPALVRLDPTKVPTGEVTVVPGAMFSALYHVMPAAQRANVGFGESPTNDEELQLTVDYPALDRQLVYSFSESFPHKLLGWRETYKGQTLSTADLKHTRQEPYWSQNSARFDGLREEIGL